MLTVDEALERLEKTREALTRAYSMANSEQQDAMDRSIEAIRKVRDKLIEDDIGSRTPDIVSLTKALKRTSKSLDDLVLALRTITQLFGATAKVVKAAQALLAIV